MRNYKKLVDQASAAVAQVKDPELRFVAFQKVLDHILAPRRRKPAAKERP